MRKNPTVRYDVAGAGDRVMAYLNGREAGNGGHSQGASCAPPHRSPTPLHLRSRASLHETATSGASTVRDTRTFVPSTAIPNGSFTCASSGGSKAAGGGLQALAGSPNRRASRRPMLAPNRPPQARLTMPAAQAIAVKRETDGA